jgi:hypothetical protein
LEKNRRWRKWVENEKRMGMGGDMDMDMGVDDKAKIDGVGDSAKSPYRESRKNHMGYLNFGTPRKSLAVGGSI